MDSPPSQSSTLAADVPCVWCGYDLRGLEVSARCPECGGLIAESVEAFSARRVVRPVDAAWRGRVMRGLCSSIIAFILPALAGVGPLGPRGEWSDFWMTTTVVIGSTWWVLSVYAVLCLTSADPTSGRDRWALRVLTRAAAVTYGLLPLVLEVLGADWMVALPAPWPVYVFFWIGFAATVLVYVCIVLIARRVGAEMTAGAAVLLAFIVPPLSFLEDRPRLQSYTAGTALSLPTVIGSHPRSVMQVAQRVWSGPWPKLRSVNPMGCVIVAALTTQVWLLMRVSRVPVREASSRPVKWEGTSERTPTSSNS